MVGANVVSFPGTVLHALGRPLCLTHTLNAALFPEHELPEPMQVPEGMRSVIYPLSELESFKRVVFCGSHELSELCKEAGSAVVCWMLDIPSATARIPDVLARGCRFALIPETFLEGGTFPLD